MRAILERLLEQAADRGDDWRPGVPILADAWEGLVGDEIAEVTRPVDVDWAAGRLTVEATTDAWARELARREPALLDRLASILPWKLRTLEFRAGTRRRGGSAAEADPRDTSEPASENAAADPVEVEPDVEESLESLPDGVAASARRILQHVDSDDSSP